MDKFEYVEKFANVRDDGAGLKAIKVDAVVLDDEGRETTKEVMVAWIENGEFKSSFHRYVQLNGKSVGGGLKDPYTGKWYLRDPILVRPIRGRYYTAGKVVRDRVTGEWTLKRKLFPVEVVKETLDSQEYVRDGKHWVLDGSYIECIGEKRYYYEDVVRVDGKLYPKNSKDVMFLPFLQTWVVNSDLIHVPYAGMVPKKFVDENTVKDDLGQEDLRHFLITVSWIDGSTKKLHSTKHDIIGVSPGTLSGNELMSCVVGIENLNNFSRSSKIYHPALKEHCENVGGTWVLKHCLDDYKALQKASRMQNDGLREYAIHTSIETDENRNPLTDAGKWRLIRNGGDVMEDYQRPPVKSTCGFGKLGGIQYSFGLEFETSAGMLTPAKLKHHSLALVGDGSCAGNEFVTSPLHGNDGYDKLKSLTNDLELSTYTNSSCGLHIHIGGAPPLFDRNGVQSRRTSGSKFLSGNAYKEHFRYVSPNFNRRFSYMAIKLGALLERELFLVANRDPSNHYCAPIGTSMILDNGNVSTNYSHINNSNYKDLIGHYVFSMSGMGPAQNSSTPTRRWNSGRYKWLNLTHCNSGSRHNTIEFRIWPGTVMWEKVESFLLISMAFTWFVENRQGMIRDGVTLTTLVVEAFGHKPQLVEQLLDFIERRKAIPNNKGLNYKCDQSI